VASRLLVRRDFRIGPALVRLGVDRPGKKRAMTGQTSRTESVSARMKIREKFRDLNRSSAGKAECAEKRNRERTEKRDSEAPYTRTRVLIPQLGGVNEHRYQPVPIDAPAGFLRPTVEPGHLMVFCSMNQLGAEQPPSLHNVAL
jgi:hypothetical protein